MDTKSLIIGVFLLSVFLMNGFSQKSQKDYEILQTNKKGEGISMEIEFQKGLKHYFPLMAIWIEDIDGNFVHSLYVAKSIAKGKFNYGKTQEGKWVSASKKIPAALPYWGHKINQTNQDTLWLTSPQNPIADAYTGATPTNSFILKTKTNKHFSETFKILFEINQAWDWNDHWYNNKYPENKEYLKSAQPALVFQAIINMKDGKNEYEMKPIGHSHPYGANGNLYPDISTLTSALKIAEKIIIRIK